MKTFVFTAAITAVGVLFCVGSVGPAVSQDVKSAADRTTAAELPTYQLLGFPISPAQAQVVASEHIEEMSPTLTLTLGGMPASPHQIAVLRRQPPPTQAATASK